MLPEQIMKTQTLSIGKTVCLIYFFLSMTVVAVFSQSETGRKPSIAVIPFGVSGKAGSGAGTEVTNSLTDELVNNGRFTVVDRSKSAAIETEILEALKGSIDQSTAAAIGRKTGAQFLVIGNVTDFGERPKASLLVVTTYEAVVKFNLRVVDSTTAEILFSKTFEKKSASFGGTKTGTISGTVDSKGMQEALDKSIKEAVAALVARLGSAVAAPPAAETDVVPGGSAKTVHACKAVPGPNPPRVMVVIPEVHISRKIPDPAGETEIIKNLVNRGFNVVDQGQIAVIRDRENVLAALNNVSAAAALGVEFGADIIIIGQAFSELAGSSGGMVSTRARVEARAIQTDTARILAADGKFGSGLDIAEFVAAKTALRNAGTQWADYFINQFCQARLAVRTEYPTNNAAPAMAAPVGATIEIVVSNVTFAQLKQIGDKLETVAGVKSVTKKLTGNVARIDVLFGGNAEQLADAISETKFGLLKVNIVGLSGNKIDITVEK